MQAAETHMKRQWIVAGVALAAALVAVFMLARPKGEKKPAPGSPAATERVFASDSLGVRLRLPDSPGWKLQSDAAPRTDGRVVAALHDGTPPSGVSVMVLPTQPEVTLDDIFRARQRQMGSIFGVDDLSKAIARVVRDTTTTCDGDPCRQYQAISMTALGADDKPIRAMLMWVGRLHGGQSYECVGMAWAPAGPVTPEDQVRSETLFNDMAYIMQSFEIR
jgi:hypothetical protein